MSKLTLYIKEGQKESIKKIAAKLGISVSELVRQFFDSIQANINVLQLVKKTEFNVGKIEINIISKTIDREYILEQMKRALKTNNCMKMKAIIKFLIDELERQ